MDVGERRRQFLWSWDCGDAEMRKNFAGFRPSIWPRTEIIKVSVICVNYPAVHLPVVGLAPLL